MKKHLEQPRSAGRAKQRLQDIDRTIPDAAWSVLRWVVASCTAHLEELTSEEEQVKNIGAPRLASLLLVCRRDSTIVVDIAVDIMLFCGLAGPEWRQFRFSVGAPDAEAKFRKALQQAQAQSANARKYPSLYVRRSSPIVLACSLIRAFRLSTALLRGIGIR